MKLQRVQEVVRNVIPDAQVDVTKSLNSALRILLSKKFDLILLDMSLPTFDISEEEDGGRPQGYGGKEILRQLKRKKIVAPVILVTQFDSFGEGSKSQNLKELSDELTRNYSSLYKGAVYYNSAVEEWKNLLQKKLNDVLRESNA